MKILRAEPLITNLVTLFLFSMLPAIHFNNQPCLKTDEVNNIGSHRELPSKFVPMNLFSLQS